MSDNKLHVPFSPVYEGYLPSHPRMKWEKVMKALSELNEVYYLKGSESEETKEALQTLMDAYNKWLD